MDTRGSCPLAAAGGGLGRCSGSHGKCLGGGKAAEYLKTPCGRAKAAAKGLDATKRFKLVNAPPNDTGMRRPYSPLQPKVSHLRPQSACNLGNVKLIEKAIRDHGNAHGTTRCNQTNVTSQGQNPIARHNQRPSTVTSAREGNYTGGTDKFPGHNASNIRPRAPHSKRVCQACPSKPPADGESSVFPGHNARNDRNMRPRSPHSRKICQTCPSKPPAEGVQKCDAARDVKKGAYKPRVYIHQGSPTIIEVRPPKPEMSSVSSGEYLPSCAYTGKYSQDLFESSDDGECGLGNVTAANKKKSLKNAGDGLVESCSECVLPQSAQDHQKKKSVNHGADNLKHSKHASNECGAGTNEKGSRQNLERSSGCRSSRDSEQFGGGNRCSMDNTKTMQKCLTKKRSCCDLGNQISKQSEQLKPAVNCIYSNKANYTQTDSTQSSCSKRTCKSSADAANAKNAELQSDESATKFYDPVQQTFQVSNNDTIVIKPGLPTLIEVRSIKGLKAKCVSQSKQKVSCNIQMQSANESEGQDSSSTAANGKRWSEDGDCSDGEKQKSRSNSKGKKDSERSKSAPEKTCKKKVCSRCYKDKSRDITFAKAGGNEIANNYVEYDAGPYQYQPPPPQYPNQYLPPLPQFQAPAMQFPMQPQYPPMPSLYSFQPAQSIHASQPQPAPYQPWNQYQPYPVAQQFPPPINYNLPQLDQTGGDQLFGMPKNSGGGAYCSDVSWSEPSLNMFDGQLNTNNGYGPSMRLDF